MSEAENERTQSHVVLTGGTMVSHYRVVEKIGAGGMGEVFLAEDTKLKRNVALKFLPLQYMKDESLRQRFTREARAVAALSHPNIVTIHEVDEFNGRPFFAMEHVSGETLKDVIKRGKLSSGEVINLVMQICEGLNEAHEAGVVHRDVKPGNIIIDGKGRARILDFGLAMVAGEDKITRTGSTLGTVGYMAPEQIEGKNVDHRSDLFSIGVILYEMVTGRRPFEGDNDAAIVRAITDSTPEPIARFKSGVTGELQRIIDKALSKDVSVRYQHADGMLADLKRIRGESAPVKTSRLSLWVAAVVVVALAGYFLADRFFLSDKGTAEGWTDSIAVLVFRDLSPNRDQDYFCEGMTDAIIGRLSAIKSLKVTSLTSVLPFKGAERNLKRIGRELGVSSILEGTIQRENGHIRVRAQLINVDNDAHLWTDYYDREMKSVFAVQDDISRAIVDVMKIQLMGEEQAALVKRGTDNIEAYNAYMQGRYFWRKRIEKDLMTAIEYFEKAIELDPDYALAYVGLGDCWMVLQDYSNWSKTEVQPKARKAIDKALSLDDRLGEAHATLGMLYFSESETEKAERELLRAIELSPGYSWAHVWYAAVLTDLMAKQDEGIEQLELALELDPLSIVALANLALRKREAGDFDTAGELYLKALEIEPDNINFLIQYAYYLTWVDPNDRNNEALRQSERVLGLDSNYWRARVCYGDMLNRHGRRQEAIEQHELACEFNPNNYQPFQAYGSFLYNTGGNNDDAIRSYSKAIELNQKAHVSHNGLAYMLDRAGEYERAIEEVNKAIELAPFATFYIDTRADIYAYNGIFDSAIADYRRFLEATPDHPNLLETIQEWADACTAAREYDLADSLYRIMASHADSSARGWGRWHQAKPLRHQGKFRQVLELLQEGIETDRSELGDCWQQQRKFYDRGCIYLFYLDRADSAIAEFTLAKELAWRLDSTSNWIIILEGRLAQAHAMAGDADRAYETLRDCWSKMDTTNSPSLNSFWYYNAGVEHILGNYDSAAVLYERIEVLWFTGKTESGLNYVSAGRTDEGVAMLEEGMARYDANRFTYPQRSVRGHYYLGQAYEAARRKQEAIEQYEIFLDIWKNADPGLKMVEDAGGRLVRLKSKT